MLIILRFNRDFWDERDERDVDTVMTTRNYVVSRRDCDTPASTPFAEHSLPDR